MAGPLKLQFLRSAALVAELPPARAEVALVGRSNVGKSSLLNALASRKELARTSKTPGATRLLNVYEMESLPKGRWVVDLPGYGFAKVPGSERQRWQGMIEGYLTERETLRTIFVLIDGEIGPTDLDHQTDDWLSHLGLPHRFVATKADKVSASRKTARRNEAAEQLGLTERELIWTSASKGIGIPELRTEITKLLDVPSQQAPPGSW